MPKGGETLPNHSNVKKNLEKKLAQNGCLIAAHRGTNGGNIVQNTLSAYLNAIAHGADIIEMDVAMTADGQFFCFHDGQEPLILRTEKNIKTMRAAELEKLYLINSANHHVSEKVNRLADVLPRLKGKNCFLNIDRSWPYWEEALKELDKYDMYDQMFAKTPAERPYLDVLKRSGSPLAYMPIVKTKAQLDMVLADCHNMVAVELVFKSDADEIVSDESIRRIKDKGLLVWGNSIRLNDKKILCALHDDDNAILNDPDSTWGWFLQRQFDIIQTDWPLLMKQYLSTKIEGE